ncbi:mechanosensitive ion channel family protein [Limimaricola hongkongensis]|uniref:Potassium efflux system KefA protein / Small-conductance mechanosensitive channel n=1 Tax=Limimaricola hongkongensis DSM 17492 TaxID=1122180 RepID=A0A017HH53_9RHOB|nr:mechanosensitive ion channel domain-containing protein [Limimaricola hongkongensis]EYD73104.1 Potassium efflux system KefA protein / Small-conductance mechanosensitive channel [Limimaricola hongkongensis DSM 17492]
MEPETGLEEVADAAGEGAGEAAEDMAQQASEAPQVIAAAAGDLSDRLLSDAERVIHGVMQPWNAWQLVILVGVFALAHLGRAWLGPKLHDWMRAREGWPRWRMRYAVTLHRRLRAVLFVGLVWIAVAAVRQLDPAGGAAVLRIVANLATGWLFVALVARLIANPLLRGLVRYGAWTWITLRILDLTTETARLLDSLAVQAGDLRISALLVVKAALVLGVAFFVARLLAQTSAHRIETNREISPSMQVLAVKLSQLFFYGIAVFVGLRAVGVDLTGLAVLSGAIGVGLGFGLQKVVSNLVSGLIILLDKSIKPGDVISVGQTFGWISTLGARYASVVTRDGKEYLIPNEDLITTQVVNWTHSNNSVRLDLNFGTAYGDDPHEVRRVAIAAAAGCGRVLAQPAPVCHITAFGDSSVDYILRFWIDDATAGLTNIRGDVFLALWDAFKAEGISIPFPQREVRVLDGSALRVARPTAE